MLLLSFIKGAQVFSKKCRDDIWNNQGSHSMQLLKSWSLRSRLIFATNVMGALMMCLVAAWLLWQKQSEGRQTLKLKIDGLVAVLKPASYPHIWNLDKNALQDLVVEIKKDSDIDWIEFKDKDNQLMSAEEKNKPTDSYEIVNADVTDKKNQVIGKFSLAYNDKAVTANVKKSLRGILGAIVICLTFFSFAMYFILSNLTHHFISLVTRLKNSVNGTSKTSMDVRGASQRVSSATTQQASAIQETVATLNEISAMVSRSVENTQNSTAKAERSHEIAGEGLLAIRGMIEAMDDIDKSNEDIMKTLNDSNEKIAGIVQMITEISSKTNVINDIVFQTKLLSFNASVEAARAGEHGKGFAVVAEEVGSLAQMSGNAAREIDNLLKDSIQKVQVIVEESRRSVTHQMESGKAKVEKGMQIAQRCSQALDEVTTNVGEVKSLMTDIAAASKEQADGVNNITIAMTELDKSTQANANTAVETLGFSGTLEKQAHSMSQVVEELEHRVFGQHGIDVKKVLKEEKSEKSSKAGLKSGLSAKKDLSVKTAAKKASKESAKVIPLKKDLSPAASPVSSSSFEPSAQVMASGHDVEVPSASDSRFEDI